MEGQQSISLTLSMTFNKVFMSNGLNVVFLYSIKVKSNQ